MIIIGSVALASHTFINMSKNIDTDVIGTGNELQQFIANNNDLIKCVVPKNNTFIIFFKTGRIVEFEMVVPESSSELIYNKYNTSEYTIAPINLLYTIKMSHRFKKNSPHFLKTMNDIHLMRCLFPDLCVIDMEVFEVREKETYNYKHPKLNVKKQDFFVKDQGVDYIFDHDDIHKIVALGDKPMYTYFIKDGADVYCDKDKFFSLTYQQQIDAVIEESMVLALERSQIPFRNQISPEKSFQIALEKVCTSITSGWFREFAWENYFTALIQYPIDYAEKFFKAVEEGLIKKVNENV